MTRTLPFKKITACIGLCISVLTAHAQNVGPYGMTVSAFKTTAEVTSFPIKTLKVVELVVPDDTQAPVLVVASGSRMFTPSIFMQNVSQADRPIVTLTQGFDTTTVNNMIDGNFSTYQDFYYSGPNGENSVGITFSYDKPITSSSLKLSFDANVTLPETVAILYKPVQSSTCKKKDAQGNCLLDSIVPLQKFTGTTVFFPKITATAFQVLFTYRAPLRISEMSFDQENKKIEPRKVRFLALPNTEYTLFAQPDRNTTPEYISAMPNLVSDDGIYREKKVVEFIPNPKYRQADTDIDGAPDVMDNCPSTSNVNQKDEDTNGKGDACEDYDRDGYMNSLDNCPLVPNYDQRDKDRDGKGDFCDKEESRFLEANVWVPWVALGVSGVVIVGLFAHVVYHGLKRRSEEEGELVAEQEKKG